VEIIDGDQIIVEGKCISVTVMFWSVPRDTGVYS
jgi:hypothetical protein